MKLRIPDSLKNEVSSASEQTGIAEHDLLRLFVRSGLDLFRQGELKVMPIEQDPQPEEALV